MGGRWAGPWRLYVASRQPRGGACAGKARSLSVFRCVTRLPLPGDKFPNIDRISQVHCPVLIMHGTADQVVPYWHGPKLLRGRQRAQALPVGAGRYAQ